MSLKFLIQRILRRWYCLLAGLLAVAGLCYWVHAQTPVQYRTQGSVVLLPSAATVGGGNPYLFLTGLGQAMDVVTRKLAAPAVKDPITQAHPGSTYTAAADLTNGSSILLISVTSETESDADKVLSTVMDEVPKILVGMQDDLSVPPNGRIGSMPVETQTVPTVDSKPRTQLLVLAAVGGVVLVFLLTALIDGLILKWNSARDRRSTHSRTARWRRRRPNDLTPAESSHAIEPPTDITDDSAEDAVPLVDIVSESPSEVSR